MLRLTGVAGTAIGLGGLAGCIGGDDDGEDDSDDGDGGQFPDDPESVAPIVFVHGSSGSATQFASNAMRFESNGVPRELLYAYEYDTSVELAENEEEVLAGLDETLDAVIERHDVDGANVLGHSRGTRVMHSYLSEEERAAKVANYVNLDGEVSDAQPGGVRTLAVWADYGIGAEEDTEIGGDAENVSVAQAHVEMATSEETFAEVYEFLFGEAPETTSIEAEPADEVTLSGRATYFPVNDGVAGGSLDVYEVDPGTGERLAEEPHASESLDDDGSWGPIDVDGEAVYEFALQRPDAGTHHFYRTPALHSNHFVRLNTSRPGEGVDQLIERGPDHASVVVTRDKEFWGDQGENNDELTIDGTNVINESTAALEDWIVAPIVFDAGSDGESNPGQPIPIFEQVSFLTGIDLHVPAADPPDGSIPITSVPRDGDGLQRELAVPNWASDEHRITVALPDHTQSR